MVGTSVDDSTVLARGQGLWDSSLLVIASGVSRLFLKGQIVNVLGLRALRSLLQLLSSAIIALKQP